MHEAATHSVPEAYLAQLPELLQTPVVPHEAAPASVHSLSGSVPPGTTAQMPFACVVFAARHERHSPTHGLLQQTPSTQAALEHSFAPAQVSPLALMASHWPPIVQKKPATQSPSSAHTALHAVAPHR